MASSRTSSLSFLALAALTAAGCDATATPGLARGEALFDTCAPCHGANGAGNPRLGAPPIAGLPEWYVRSQLEKFQAGQRGAHPMDTVGIRMKSMSLALDLDGDVESVAGYVASLTASTPQNMLDGDAQAGAAIFAICAACHGPNGSGNEALSAPPLTGQGDWYVAAQLRKFRSGWRGSAPGDITGATMRANAMTLDDAAIENLAAYIETLR
jgi:cbb3-type cytochrome c oxidase subunit III